MGIESVRRYYLLKSRLCEANDEIAMALVFKWKYQNVVGTPLGATFPARDKLAAASLPYTTIEDVSGASIAELVKYAGLTRTEAAAVIAAVED